MQNTEQKQPETAPLGMTGKVSTVHKAGHEGVLLIDTLTGVIAPKQEDKPEWAESLVMAHMAERINWYSQKAGPSFPGYLSETYAFEDLMWTQFSGEYDANEEPILETLEYDEEFRMDVLAAFAGLDRETGEVTGRVLAEKAIAGDQYRTPEELAALEASQQERFAAAGGSGE